MTDAPLEASGSLSDETLADAWEDTLPTDELRELFSTLGKALRAHQLYDRNNPVYQRFVNALASSFETVLGEMDRFTVRVTETAMTCAGQEVYSSSSRSDSLAFLFFKDGIREMTFSSGLDQEELVHFLDVLQEAKNVRAESDDLVSLLWEADLSHIKHQYVDLLTEGVVLPETGPGGSEEAFKEVQTEVEEGEAEEEEDEEDEDDASDGTPDAPKQVSRDDFNPTLYSLDAREMEKLRREIELERERDLRRDVLSALFDRLEEPDDRERQSEIIAIFLQLLPNFLSRGALSAATLVLSELRRMEGIPELFDEERQEEVDALFAEVSSFDAMAELVQALADGSMEPEPQDLSRFLGFLEPQALGPLLRALELTESSDLKGILKESIIGLGHRFQGSVLSLLDEEDPVVLAGAARLAGWLGIPDAGGHLAELMLHADPAVRLAAVEAAGELRASTAASGLSGILEDPDPDVRIAAVRTLGQLQYRPVAGYLGSLIKSKEMREKDLSEKIAFFESYGYLAGANGIPLLDKLLNSRGFFGQRPPAEIRACAALALGKIDTQEARDSLERAVKDEEPVIRSAVNRALRGEDLDRG